MEKRRVLKHDVSPKVVDPRFDSKPDLKGTGPT